MGRRYNNGTNLMMYNFPRTSAVYKFLDLARAAVKEGGFTGIDSKLIQKAKDEFSEFRRGIDAVTPYFSRELADITLGADSRRRIVVVHGGFEGDYNERSIIGYDLGSNSHMLYKAEGKPKKETKDDNITKEAVRDYLRSHYEELRRRGVDGFRVTNSALFSIREADLKYFRNTYGEIGMEQLLPLVADTILNTDKQTGYVGINLVHLPDRNFYVEHSPSFTSSRIKSTLGRKLIRQLLLTETVPIRDIGAHRCKIASPDAVRDLDERIGQGHVGKSKVEIIPGTKKDFYRNPKPNGYKGIQFSAYVTTKRGKFVREIQLVDSEQYYKNEVDPNNSAHHRQQEKKQVSSNRQVNQIPEQILEAIQKIFGKSTIRIGLEEARNL
jgi:hypothetical protein